MEDLDIPGSVVGWRFALGGGALLLATVLAVLNEEVPGAAAVARHLDGLASRVLAFERWVIEALAGAVATLALAAAWTAAVVDTQVIGAPGDAVARRVVRAAGVLRPVVGGSLSRVVWVIVGVLLATCGGHALWPGR